MIVLASIIGSWVLRFLEARDLVAVKYKTCGPTRSAEGVAPLNGPWVPRHARGLRLVRGRSPAAEEGRLLVKAIGHAGIGVRRPSRPRLVFPIVSALRRWLGSRALLRLRRRSGTWFGLSLSPWLRGLARSPGRLVRLLSVRVSFDKFR